MPSLERIDDVRVLDFGPGEHRINPDWIASLSGALDEVTAAAAPRGLVITASSTVVCLGLDLEWMASNPGGVSALVESMHQAFARLLELPLPTVAAIQGHAFAGGGLFALAHDYRVMREDRGWFCLPEVDGGIAFTPGLIDLVRARLAPQTAHEALTAGRRYSGPEALEARIADAVAPLDEVVPKAAEIAAGLAGKPAETYGTIKARLYRHALASLRDTEANFADVSRFQAAMDAVGLTRH